MGYVQEACTIQAATLDCVEHPKEDGRLGHFLGNGRGQKQGLRWKMSSRKFAWEMRALTMYCMREVFVPKYFL
jgi:hypothetical protein